MNKVHIVGAGGVGSWLVPSLCCLVGPQRIIVYDGDKLEAKNLSRQFYTANDIGKNKAEALAAKYGCVGVPSYYSFGMVDLSDDDWVICCADNNPARAECLMATGEADAKVIIAANEKTSAEALHWSNFVEDCTDDPPEDHYPGLWDDKRDDPRAAAIGCTGAAQEQTPQLVSANFMAASLAQWLFVLWALEAPSLDLETLTKLPFKLVANMTRLETYRLGKLAPETQERTANE